MTLTLTSQSAQRQQKCKIHLSFLYFLVVLGLYNFEFSPKTRARKKKRKEKLFFSFDLNSELFMLCLQPKNILLFPLSEFQLVWIFTFYGNKVWEFNIHRFLLKFQNFIKVKNWKEILIQSLVVRSAEQKDGIVKINKHKVWNCG